MFVFGRPLSVPIALVGCSQIMAAVALVVVPGWEESFASMSNLAYVLSGCYHSFQTNGTGSLANPAFPLLFLGVASFAFHSEPQGQPQKHALDIFGGWMLVLHLSCTTISAAVTVLASEFRLLWPYAHLVDVGFVIVFSSALLLLAILYSRVYDVQLLFYIVCAGTAIVFALTIRIRLANFEPLSVGIALFESVATVATATSAVFLQGELVGNQLSYATDGELYNLMHGMWHIHLAFVVSLMHVRFADILQQTKQTRASQSHITNVAFVDAVAVGAFAMQSIVWVVMKEARVAALLLRSILWVGCAFHGLHIAWLVYGKYRPKRAVRWRSGHGCSRPNVSPSMPTCHQSKVTG